MAKELKKITVTPKAITIDSGMTIADIIQKIPQAALILNDFKLGCASCSIGTIETLKDGVMGHGMSEDDVKDIVTEINNIATTPRVFIDADGVLLTEEAYDKVLEFMRADPEKRKNLALRIEVVQSGDRFQYFFDLVAKKKAAEKELVAGSLKIFIGKKALDFFADHYIDYQETAFGAGFKVEKRMVE
jgi:hybrid cluster-associated redox disulfide protein